MDVCMMSNIANQSFETNFGEGQKQIFHVGQGIEVEKLRHRHKRL